MELHDAQHGYVESRREQVRAQDELSLKAKVLRDTQRRSLHEMGKTKRAQELRVDEVSVQKLRENHETIQRLTSQMQEMQEQTNSMNDSGEFQEVESNHSGRLSYVSSLLAMIPSSRSMLSRDKRLPLDTWITSGLQENAVGNQFSTFDSLRDPPQRKKSDDVQRNREAVLEAERTKTTHTSQDRLNQGTIPMPTFATKPLRVLQYRWKFRRILWSDSKDSKYRNCKSTHSLIYNRFSVKNTIQNSSDHAGRTCLMIVCSCVVR